MAKQEGDYFYQLVFMFQTAALQQLGKLVSPLTNQIERDLEQARFSIDMLGMLEEKTKGNLSDQEAKFLQTVLSQLRLNYVDEANKPEEQPEQKLEKEEKPDKPEST
jgi:hypothetical protein